MFTRNDVTSTTSDKLDPSVFRIESMFSSTALVCALISRLIVPISSTSTPAKVLSDLLLLVPDTNKECFLGIMVWS